MFVEKTCVVVINTKMPSKYTSEHEGSTSGKHLSVTEIPWTVGMQCLQLILDITE